MANRKIPRCLYASDDESLSEAEQDDDLSLDIPEHLIPKPVTNHVAKPVEQEPIKIKPIEKQEPKPKRPYKGRTLESTNCPHCNKVFKLPNCLNTHIITGSCKVLKKQKELDIQEKLKELEIIKSKQQPTHNVDELPLEKPKLQRTKKKVELYDEEIDNILNSVENELENTIQKKKQKKVKEPKQPKEPKQKEPKQPKEPKQKEPKQIKQIVEQPQQPISKSLVPSSQNKNKYVFKFN